MITRKDVMPVNFLKKEKFTGSDTGMRYRMEMTKREVPKEDGADGETVEETVLTVTSWPEPFSEEGIVSGVEWLNGQHARYVKPEK